jgi:hypothetical protein
MRKAQANIAEGRAAHQRTSKKSRASGHLPRYRPTQATTPKPHPHRRSQSLKVLLRFGNERATNPSSRPPSPDAAGHPARQHGTRIE